MAVGDFNLDGKPDLTVTNQGLNNVSVLLNCPTITVTNPATTTGTVGTTFSQTFMQTGGSGMTNFSLNSGSLPTGLTLASDGTLSGTPTQSGTFPITVKVTDGNNCPGAGATYNLVINCPSFTVGTPTATGALGTAYNSSAAAAPAVSAPLNYRYSLANGTTLPAGLSLDANTGAITGTPTATGNVSFDLKVELFNDNTATGCAVTVQRSINITCVTDPVVMNTNDSGTGSLRQAIADACPGSTITFANGINLITLTSGELVLNKNLTIQGPGAATLSVSGNNNSRIFRVSASATATINDLTITKGKAGDVGGGIVSDGNLTMNRCAITNSASASGFTGGGVYQAGGVGAFTDCTFSGNTATIGAGLIIINSSAMLTNCTISGNSVVGIRFQTITGGTAKTLNITNCTIANHVSGGLEVVSPNGISAAVTLRNTLLDNNGGRNLATDGNVTATILHWVIIWRVTAAAAF